MVRKVQARVLFAVARRLATMWALKSSFSSKPCVAAFAAVAFAASRDGSRSARPPPSLRGLSPRRPRCSAGLVALCAAGREIAARARCVSYLHTRFLGRPSFHFCGSPRHRTGPGNPPLPYQCSCPGKYTRGMSLCDVHDVLEPSALRGVETHAAMLGGEGEERTSRTKSSV